MPGLSDIYGDDIQQMRYMQMLQGGRGRRGSSNPMQPVIDAVGMYSMVKQEQEMARTKQEMNGLVQRYLMGDPESGNQIYEYLKNHPNEKFKKIGESLSPDYFNKLLDGAGDDEWFIRAASQMSGQNFVPPEMRDLLTKKVMDYEGAVATTRGKNKAELEGKKAELSDPELRNLQLDKINTEALVKILAENKGKNMTLGDAISRTVAEQTAKTNADIQAQNSPKNLALIAQGEQAKTEGKGKGEKKVKSERVLTTQEAQDLQVPYGTTEQDAYGKNIVNKKSQDTLQTLNAAKTVLDQINPLVDKIYTAKPGIGNVLAQKGKLAYQRIAQDEPTARLYESKKMGFLSTLARSAGEKGNLSDNDIKRAESLFPNDTDTRETAISKMQGLNDFLTELSTRTQDTYSTSGGVPKQGKTSSGIGFTIEE